MKERLIDIYENSKRRGTNEMRERMNFHFVGQPFVEILGEKNNNDYDILLLDKDRNNEIVKHDTIKINHWIKEDFKWFINYQIRVFKNKKPLFIHDYNAKNRRVYIQLDSKALGDTIAWIPYVEEFRKKHQCEVICSTFWNGLFVSKYPKIKFVNPGVEMDDLYAMYVIGINPNDPFKNKRDWRTIPLQQTATDMLGLEYKEIRPEIDIPYSNMERPKKPYVCIATHSTAQAKYWNNPDGWRQVVDYLVDQGYEVVSISKEGCDLDNVTVIKDKPIQDVIDIINRCIFFIGLTSGLSWLAWALKKKVIMISGFSKSWFEFKENNYYVQKDDGMVCTGCFVDTFVEFDKGDWNWCPYHKDSGRQFECTKRISGDMVIEKIKEIQNV